jgi:hypothetical protein
MVSKLFLSLTAMSFCLSSCGSAAISETISPPPDAPDAADVGYAIPQSELPANAATRFAAKPPKKAASACGE